MTATITENTVGTSSRTESVSIVDMIQSDEPGQSSHIVLVPEDKKSEFTPQSWVLQARIEGIEIQALCGHIFIPQRDPKNLPACSKCLEIYKNDPYGKGDRDQLPDA